MEIKEEEVFSVWLSLANTVFVSVAVVLWYFFIWQEEEKEQLDESRIIILDNNRETELSQETKMQETSEKSLCLMNDADATDQSSSLYKQINPVDYDKKDDTNCPASKTRKANESVSEEHERKETFENKTIPAITFKWPLDADILEILRHQQSKSNLKSDILSSLDSMGIRREVNSEVLDESTVPLCQSARMAAKLLTKKPWVIFDTFMGKSRPGLEQTASPKSKKANKKSTESPKPKRSNKTSNRTDLMWPRNDESSRDVASFPKETNSPNQKKKSVKGWRSDAIQSSKRFIEQLKKEECVKSVCAA